MRNAKLFITPIIDMPKCFTFASIGVAMSNEYGWVAAEYGSRCRDYWPRACSSTWTTIRTNKDIGTSTTLITTILHLFYVCSVRGNGYQRVDVPGSRKMAGIVSPLEWRSARNIGIDELQRGTWYICIVFFLLIKKILGMGNFNSVFVPVDIKNVPSMLMVMPHGMPLRLY